MMMKRFLFYISVLSVILVSCPALWAGSEEGPAIEPKADKILKQMSEYLRGAKQFTYHVESGIDQVLDNGQKLMYTATIDVSVRRPDRLQVDVQGDLKDIRFWYDGKSATLYDINKNLYATAKTPAKIDDALEDIGRRFDATLPVADFVLKDAYAALTANVQSGFYVGLHDINEVMCHHLAFRQEEIDWQIWIEDGRMLVPRLLVITYKQVEGSPQYVAALRDWDLSPRLPESFFTFMPPEGAEQIEFLPAESPVIPEKNK